MKSACDPDDDNDDPDDENDDTDDCKICTIAGERRFGHTRGNLLVKILMEEAQPSNKSSLIL